MRKRERERERVWRKTRISDLSDKSFPDKRRSGGADWERERERERERAREFDRFLIDI